MGSECRDGCLYRRGLEWIRLNDVVVSCFSSRGERLMYCFERLVYCWTIRPKVFLKHSKDASNVRVNGSLRTFQGIFEHLARVKIFSCLENYFLFIC
jgi:hypothetical protein